MIRLISAEVFKLRTTHLYSLMLAIAVGLVVLVTGFQLAAGDGSSWSIEGAVSAVATPEDLRSILNVAGLAGLFTLVLGATAVASEHRHGTIVGAFLVTPSRSRVILAKVITYTLAGVVFGIVVELAVLAEVSVWLAATGATIPFSSSVTSALVAGPVITGLAAGTGVGISAAVPNQLGAVLLVIGWAMVVEQLVSGLLPGLAPWLPLSGVAAAIAFDNPEVGEAAGVVLGVTYMILFAGLGVQLTKQRDVA
jgi:ABC-type transport system involved in multi-copper enzyme maturation permease subunit